LFIKSLKGIGLNKKGIETLKPELCAIFAAMLWKGKIPNLQKVGIKINNRKARTSKPKNPRRIIRNVKAGISQKALGGCMLPR